MKCKKCGLFVRTDLPYLGASPDSVIDSETLIEVKCPYAGREALIVPGKLFPFLCYDGERNIVLKESCHYYNQIQEQMYISNRTKCYFVVYTFKDLFANILLFLNFPFSMKNITSHSWQQNCSLYEQISSLELIIY